MSIRYFQSSPATIARKPPGESARHASIHAGRSSDMYRNCCFLPLHQPHGHYPAGKLPFAAEKRYRKNGIDASRDMVFPAGDPPGKESGNFARASARSGAVE